MVIAADLHIRRACEAEAVNVGIGTVLDEIGDLCIQILLRVLGDGTVAIALGKYRGDCKAGIDDIGRIQTVSADAV